MNDRYSRFLGLAALIIFGLAVSPAWSGRLDQIKQTGLKVCLEPGYMPFIMKDKQGKIIGYDPDLADLLAKELGAAKLELIDTPWADIIPALLANKCDLIMSGMSITEERRQKVDFSNAYIVIGQSALLRKALAGQVKSHTDLNDAKYKVTSKQGTTGETTVKTYLPNAQYLPSVTAEDGVAQVLAGKVDAFIYDSPFNAVAMGQHGNDKMAFLETPFTFEPIGCAVRKGDPELLASVNSFINKIQKNGTRYTLYKKWFKNMDWLKDVQ